MLLPAFFPVTFEKDLVKLEYREFAIDDILTLALTVMQSIGY